MKWLQATSKQCKYITSMDTIWYPVNCHPINMFLILFETLSKDKWVDATAATVSNQTVKQKDIKNIVPQSQGVLVDCEAFSVANVISLLHNTDPSNIPSKLVKVTHISELILT